MDAKQNESHARAAVDLAEVFEDDSDVHVDDNEEADDEVGDQVGNG